MFVVRLHTYPALGKTGEFRDLLAAYIKARQAEGVRVGLQSQLFADGTVYVSVSTYPSLADYEKRRAENAADPEYQKLAVQLQLMSRLPPRTDIFESLIPLSV